MEPFGIGMAGLTGLATFGAFGLAFRQRRRRLAAAPRSPADRLEALGAAQAELALRLDALAERAGAPEERLQAMAGQLLGLIRDKNATLETALAGLDQLRARMRALEQIGEPAEARALYEALAARIDVLQAAQAAAAAGLEARLEGLSGNGDLAERLARLQESRDAGLEAALARMGPLETRLAGLEAGREATRRLEARLEALQAEAGAARTEVAALKEAPRALGEQLARLLADKEALAGRLAGIEAAARGPEAALAGLAARLESLQERLAPLEDRAPFAAVTEQLAALRAERDAALAAVLGRLAEVEARDPEAALAAAAARLDGLGARLGALEADGPFADLAARLAGLHAQKDAAVEAVLARLAPLEAKLAEIDGGLAARDPRAALEALQQRLAALEEAGHPLAEIAERLAGLHAQKDAAVGTVLGRLAPLEAKLAEIEGGLAARDPRAALAGFAERLEGMQGRVAALEAEKPLAEVSERLAGLHAQKDAAVATVLARLAEIEARDPGPALAEAAARLDGLGDRLGALEADGPLAEISERLAGLHAQKDAAVEAVLARLAPLEAKLAEIEGEVAGRDPRAALDGFAERLEAVRARLATLEEAGSPLAEISDRLAGLHAQRDAAVEAVLARLEARLAEIEGGLARVLPLAEDDPRAAVEGLRARLEALHWAQGEVAAGLAALREAGGGALAGVAEQLARLLARDDALPPLAARLAALEARDPAEAVREAEVVREAGATAVGLIAARAEGAPTLFADRISALEASLPRPAAGPAAPEAAPGPDGLEAIWSLPGVVSLHRK